jgi:hypothetical protein
MQTLEGLKIVSPIPERHEPLGTLVSTGRAGSGVTDRERDGNGCSRGTASPVSRWPGGGRLTRWRNRVESETDRLPRCASWGPRE